MELVLKNYTGLEIEAGFNFGETQKIACGSDATIKYPPYLSNESIILNIKSANNKTSIDIPRNIKPGYTIAIGTELENGNVKMINCKGNKLVNLFTSLSLNGVDEVMSFKVGGLGMNKYNTEYSDKLYKTTGLDEQIANYICRLPGTDTFKICSYGRFNWTIVLVILLAIIFGILICIMYYQWWKMKSK